MSPHRRSAAPPHRGSRPGRVARVLAVLACLGAVASVRLAAQQPPTSQVSAPQLLDRIVAIVGDKPILQSEVDEKINQARSQGMTVPEDTAQLRELRRTVLSGMIDEEVVYQAARRDTSVTVTDAEVLAAVDQQFNQVKGQFRTDPEFRAALAGAGWQTPEEYRRYLTEQSRRTSYGQRYIEHQTREGKIRAGTVSEQELRDFFEQARVRGGMQPMPASITFRQVVIGPKPSAAERAEAYRLADSLRLAIERGADFATLARRYSDDPGSKPNGGDLGFFRRGQMVRAFEETAFGLRPGVVSPVVQTEYGYHLIMVDRVLPAEVKARHILIAPAVSDSERAVARRTADTVAARLRAGASPDSLARVYGDSGEPTTVGPTARDAMPPAYKAAFDSAAAGRIVGPVMVNPETPERSKWLVAVVTSVQAERQPGFEDLREQVRQQLLQQKGIKNLIDDLKRQVYVDVRL